MPLKVSKKSPTHDITLTIDDEPVRAHVKRLTKAEGEAFNMQMNRITRPRGAKEPSDEELDQKESASREFAEQSIRQYVTFEPGDVIGDDDEQIITGDQIVDYFCNRKDVLLACYQAVHSENLLGKEKKRILKLRGTFSPGSKPSTRIPDGPEPAPTVPVAENSTTAVPEHAAASLSATPSSEVPGEAG